MKGIHRESPWCAPGTLLIQCRLHKTKKHTVKSSQLEQMEQPEQLAPAQPAGSAPQTGAAGAPQPRHMTPCACHCAACRAAGHGGKHGACVVLCAGLHDLFDGKADVVELVW